MRTKKYHFFPLFKRSIFLVLLGVFTVIFISWFFLQPKNIFSAPHLTWDTLYDDHDFPRDGEITLFSESSLNAASFEHHFSIEPSVAGKFVWNTNNTQVTFRADSPWDPGISYRVSIARGVTSLFGIRSDTSLERTIIPASTFHVVSIYPESGLAAVAPDSPLRFTFNYASIDFEKFKQSFSLNPQFSGTFLWEGRSVLFYPDSYFPYDQSMSFSVADVHTTSGYTLDLKKIEGEFHTRKLHASDFIPWNSGSVHVLRSIQQRDMLPLLLPKDFSGNMVSLRIFRGSETSLLDTMASDATTDAAAASRLIADGKLPVQAQWTEPVQTYTFSSSDDTEKGVVSSLHVSENGIYLVEVSGDKLAPWYFHVILSRFEVSSNTIGNEVSLFTFDSRFEKPVVNAPVVIYNFDHGMKKIVRGFTNDHGIFRSSFKQYPHLALVYFQGEIVADLSQERKMPTSSALQPVFIETDKQAYRPSDVIHFYGSYRPLQDFRPQSSISGQFLLRLTNVSQPEHVVFEKTYGVDERGVFSGEIPPLRNISEDDYQLEVSLKDEEVYKKTIFIGNIGVPDFSVSVDTGGDMFVAGDRLNASVTAHTDFGLPLSGQNLHYILSLPHKTLEGKETLDHKGEKNLEIPIPSDGWEGRENQKSLLLVEVSDKSGNVRKIFRELSIQPASFSIALDTSKKTWQQNENVVIPFRLEGDSVFAGHETVISGFALPSLSSMSDGSKKPNQVRQQFFSLRDLDRGKGEAHFSFGSGGAYDLFFEGKDGKNRVTQQKFTVWIDAPFREGTMREVNSDQLSLHFDQERYVSGDHAKVFIRTPQASGNIFLTLSRSEIFDQRIIPVNTENTVVDLGLAEKYIPFVHVAVDFLSSEQSLSQSADVSVTSSHDAISLQIDPTPLSCVYGQDMKARLALVDSERNKIPAHFLAGVSSTTINEPSSRHIFSDSIAWEPDLVSSSEEDALFNVPIPASKQEWYLTVYGTSSDHRVAQQTIRLACHGSYTFQPVFPKVLTLGDEFFVGAALQNFTGSDTDFHLFLSSDLPFSGESEKRFLVPANTLSRLSFGLNAIYPPKPAALSFTMTEPESQTFSTNISVSPFAEMTEIVSAGNGDDVRFDFQVVPDSRDHVVLHLSSTPHQAVNDALFPFLSSSPLSHEEIASRLFSLSLFSKTSDFSPQDEMPRLQERIASDREVLLRSQNSDGGWGWHPGTVSDPLLTAYVLKSLSVAPAPEALPSQLSAKAVHVLQEFFVSAVQPDERAYIASVLDDFNAVSLADVQKLSSSQELSPFGYALLALIFSKQQDMDSAHTMMARLNERAYTDRSFVLFRGPIAEPTHAFFFGDTAVTSLALRAYLALDPSSPSVQPMVDFLLSRRYGSSWQKGGDTAHVVQALSDYEKVIRHDKQDYEYEIYLRDHLFTSGRVQGDQPLPSLRFEAKDLFSGDNEVVIKKKGEGSLWYSFLAQDFEDVPSLSAENQGMTVSREYLNQQGQALSSIRVGDVIKTRLTVKKEGGLADVRISDFLPAGFRLIPHSVSFSPDNKVPFSSSLRSSDEGALDLAFFHPDTDTVIIEYALRAVLAGHFRVLPAHAYFSFDSLVDGRSVNSELKVEE